MCLLCGHMDKDCVGWWIEVKAACGLLVAIELFGKLS